MKKTFLIFLFVLFWPILLNGQYKVGNIEEGADIATLSEAFNALMTFGDALGDVTLEIISDITETSPAVLYPSGYNGSTYTSFKVFTNTPGLTVTCNLDGPLFDIAGGTNFTIDGSVSGSTDLTISNSSTTASACVIRFGAGAHDNIIQYCNIKGSGSSGIIIFGTESSGSGNSSNQVLNNDITNLDNNRPSNVIYSAGALSRPNNSNSISHNNIHDFLRKNASSNGIYLSSYNNDWTINGNSFYESSSFTPTGSYIYNIIYLSSAGTGTSISQNYIGGNSPSCGGTWTKTNSFNSTFTGINVNAGTGTATSIQGNTISAFSWTNSGGVSWTGIEASAGTVNIGTDNGNIIGSDSGTGSIVVTDGSLAGVYGITISGTSAVSCENNTIGAITAASSSATVAVNFYGINRSSGGTTTIISNTIGNETTANSINASSTSTLGNQFVFGINNSGSGSLTIDDNLVANLNNATTRSTTGALTTGRIQGIASTSGNNTITNNIIHDLKIANANNNTGINTTACGIMASSSGTNIITGNTVHDISNSFSSFGGHVIGIYAGNAGCNNQIDRNFIYSLSVTGSTFNNAYITGIRTSLTAGTASIYNNIISFSSDIDRQLNVVGIWEPGASGAVTGIYFNSVYIGGTVPSGTSTSYALYNPSNASSRNIRNNILENYRNTDGGSNLHFGLYISTINGGSLTCDYNDYFVASADQGGTPGYYGTPKTILPIVTSQDANSYIEDPLYASAGSTDATDYLIETDLIGLTISGISTDYGNISRVNPTMGAWERLQNFWTGAASTAWDLKDNWSAGAIPLDNVSITFAETPSRNLYLDKDHIVKNINNASSYQVVTNNHKLTVKGNIQGMIDATSSSSILAYAGTTAQAIDGANFVSSEAANVIIDNTAGVTLSSDFTIDNDLNIVDGRILTVSAPYTLTVSGNISNALSSGLVLKSTDNGVDAKLINDNAAVPATVELTLSGGTGVYGPAFHYIVPGVQSMSFDNSSVSACAASLGLTSFAGDLMRYNEPNATTDKNSGWEYFDGYPGFAPGSGFNVLSSTRGYNIHLTAKDRMILTGSLNGAVHTFSLSYTGANPDPGWNLVGNPYPCNYNLESIDALTTEGDDVDNTVYFNYEGGYGTYNVQTHEGTLNGGSSTMYSSIMPPMQGFFVRARSTGKSLVLPVSGKTNSAAAPSRSKKSSASEENSYSEAKTIRLALQDGKVRDETLVCVYDKATFGFDGDYDAYKLFETDAPFRSGNFRMFNIPSIYTNLGGTNYAMNYVPEPRSGLTVIPVSIRIKRAGTYNIQATEFKNLDGTKVVLKHGDVETVLGPGITYSFKTDSGTYNNFSLIIGESVESGNEKPFVSTFSIWYANDHVFIKSPSDIVAGERRVIIYDTQGKPVFDGENVYLTPEDIVNLPVSLRKGVYLVNIKDTGKPYVSKIVVLK